jgi:hypothetical protein
MATKRRRRSKIILWGSLATRQAPEKVAPARRRACAPQEPGQESAHRHLGNHDRFTAATLKTLGVAAHLPVPFEPHVLELALHDLFGLWRPYLLQAIDQADKSDQPGVNDLRKVRA